MALASHEAPVQDRSQSRLKILLVTHDLGLTGAPKLVVEIATALVSLNFEVIVCSPKDGPFRSSLQTVGASVLVEPNMLGRNSSILRALSNLVDAAICNTAVTDGAILTLDGKVPCLWYFHEISFLRTLIEQPDFIATLAKPDAVWAGSELSAQVLRARRPDIAVVPYGLPPWPLPAQTGRDPARTLRIVVMASIERRKGQDIAVAALQRVKPATAMAIDFCLFGAVLEAPFADAVFDALEALSNARYGGVLDYGEYLEQLAAADAVLVPSRDDTMPLVSLDALSSGRVLMVSTAVGTATYLTDGVNGFIAAEATPEALAALLDRAVAERGAWDTIGEAGKRTFEQNFSQSAFIAELNKWLIRVCPHYSAPLSPYGDTEALNS